MAQETAQETGQEPDQEPIQEPDQELDQEPADPSADEAAKRAEDLSARFDMFDARFHGQTAAKDQAALFDDGRALAETALATDDAQLQARGHAVICKICGARGAPNADRATLRQGVEAGRAALSLGRFEGVARRRLTTALAICLNALGVIEEDAPALREAVQMYEAAAAAIDKSERPDAWALSVEAGAGALAMIGDLTGDAAPLGEAVARFEAAREVWRDLGRDEDAVTATYNAGVAMMMRAWIDGDLAMVRASVSLKREAQAAVSREEDPETWAMYTAAVASTDHELALAEADADRARDAIAGFRAALAALDGALPDDRTAAEASGALDTWAMTAGNLAQALALSAALTDDAPAYAEAAREIDRAVAAATRDAAPGRWAELLAARASCNGALAALLDDASLYRAAVEDLTAVLEERRAETAPSARAVTLRERAAIQFERGRAERDPAHLRAAVDDLDEAAALLAAAPAVAADMRALRAEALTALATSTDDGAAAEAAASSAEAAARDATGPATQADAALALGRARLAQAAARRRAADGPSLSALAAGAAAAFGDAATGSIASARPLRRLEALVGRAEAALLGGDLDAARDAADAAFRARDEALVRASGAHERTAVFRAAARLADAAAAARLRCGDVAGALSAFEAGRATTLRARLAQREASMSQDAAAALSGARTALSQARRAYRAALGGGEPALCRAALSRLEAAQEDFDAALAGSGLDIGGVASADIDPATLGAALRRTGFDAAIALIATVDGGAAVIIRANGPPEALEIPAMSASAVDRLLWGVAGDGWLDAYRAFRLALERSGGAGDAASIRAWRASVARTREALWDMLGAPLADRLGALGLTSGARVAIAPTGRLSALPLAAAGRGERALIDDLAVALSPGLGALIAAAARDAAPPEPTLLAVTDPDEDLDTPVNPAEPAFAPERSIRLRGASATRPAVLAGLRRASHVSVFAHAWWDPDAPEASFVQLADGARLTAGELADLNLSRVQIVALGACESGVPGVKRAPDEFEGLPGALMQAGAAGVVATLWPVFNRVSEDVLRAFFAAVAEGASPVSSLRDAQRAIRDAGGAMAAGRMAQGLRRGAAAAPKASTERSRADAAEAFDPADPAFWAAFVFYGV